MTICATETKNTDEVTPEGWFLSFDCATKSFAWALVRIRSPDVIRRALGDLSPALAEATAKKDVAKLAELSTAIRRLDAESRGCFELHAGGAADLLALPSRWEGLPMVLLEAMARELPVVGTRINGLVDIIEEGRQGLLVDVDDSEGLAAAIEKMVREPGIRLEMGRAAKDLVREKFDFRRVYDDLCRVYDTAMSR